MISKIALMAALAAAPMTSVMAQSASTPAPAASSVDDEAKTKQAQDIIVTGRFVDTGAKSAMKMDVRVLDTPFSVQSYSSSFVKSLEVANVSDLYNYMTGLKKSGATAYDITIRGFKSGGTDRNAIMMDGLPGLTGRYTSPPVIGLDHVELVKGPMSVLYGQIQPGGFVNMISKKPSDHANTMIEMKGMTYAADGRPMFNKMGYSGAVDSTGPLINDDITYRIVGQVTRNNTFRAYNYTNQEVIQPSVRVRLGSKTTITGQFEYRHTKEHFDVGLSAPFDGQTALTSSIYDITKVASRYTGYSQPDNFRDEEGKAETVFVTHQFNSNWRVAASFRHVDYFSNQQDLTVFGENRYGGIYNNAIRLTRRARQLQTTRYYNYGDLNVQGTFHTFGFEHKIIVGINGGTDMTRNNRLKFNTGTARNTTTGICPAGGICLDVDPYNPELNQTPAFDLIPAGTATGLTDQITHARNYGLYISDLITFTPWLKASVAARKFSEYQSSSPDARNTPNIFQEKTNSKNFLPSAGILVEPTHNITVYTSYAESFVPPDPGSFDINGVNSFTPITAKQYELGIKAQNLLNNRLGFSAAIYRIDQNGQLSGFLCALGNCFTQSGTSRADGFEVESNITPTKNWNIILGYSHVIAKVIKSIPTLSFQTGRELPNVAKDAANIWTRYDFRNGLGVGFGVTYTGDRQGILPTQANALQSLDLPAYTIVDAGIYYTHNKWSIDMKFGNLFDKTYYESSGGGSAGIFQIQPGAPRNIVLTGRINF